MLFLSACGVKGDPLPPEQPPRIGTGEPNFTKGISSASEEEPLIPVEDIYEEEE